LSATGVALHFSLEEHTHMSKVWFITGTSKGFGRIWAEAALERGDRVAATARRPETLAGLADRYVELVLPMALDVTDKAAVDAAVAQAHAHFGRLDVVVNNAGYGLFGTIEEVTEEQARAQIETNLFGALWVTKAALPILREQGSGHIIQVSSIGGVNAFPTVGLYHASKWGLEGFSQSLAQEVAEFGIKVTLVEPVGFSTDWAGASGVRAERLPAYAEVWKRREAQRASAPVGDPEATGPAILELVDAEEPPLRVFFGDGPLEMIRNEYAKRIAEWEAWNDLSVRAHGGVLR
jgi:NAD(P)-dependent dehydrogenase (short-subunit alcohol dehydrogenase family)